VRKGENETCCISSSGSLIGSTHATVTFRHLPKIP